ncbi:MAG: NAD(P)/FAD-dependent oxidoreductase [Dehalococcoidia bacterium]
MKVGIVGGGIAGLAAALELTKRGHEVSVLEKGAGLGGQMSTFSVGGQRLERFYHHMFTSDAELLGLIQELGLGPRLRWFPSKVGFYHGGSVYNFVTPLDLLRFAPLGLVDRIRLGLLSLYLQRTSRWQRFESLTAQEWLARYAGRRGFEVVWGPLLRGKFGPSAGEVSMAWFWSKMRLRFGSRGRGMQRERLGYVEGSFGLVIDALAQRIRGSGGRILTRCPVDRVRVGGGGLEVEVPRLGRTLAFDAVIATVPSPRLLEMVPGLPDDYASKLRDARYLAALCLVLILKRPLSHIYWLNISDPDIPFAAVIEHTNLVPPRHYGGRRVLYISNYVPYNSPSLKLRPGQLLARYLPHLKKINPEFDMEWIERYYLFREEAAQPIITTNYSKRLPGHRTPIPGLYVANTAQIYPEDRGMNYSLRLGLKVSQMVLEEGKGEIGDSY